MNNQPYYPWHRDILAYIEQQITAKRLPHALLFRCRPYYFDTTLGWQIIQRLLCDSQTATDHCQQCRLVAEYSHPNVFFLDVHHEKVGIDAIRQLEQQMWQTAVFNKPKIAFINGMDLLSIAAQNALLKTLEEPPKHVFFILSVETISHVLPTIISRVQRLKHTAIDASGEQAILQWLQQRLLAANQASGKEEITNIAQLADFAPERALALLKEPEQVKILEQEKRNFAQFMAGKYSTTALVDSMDHANLAEQLSRYQQYVDSLIHVLFEKTAQQSNTKAENPIKYMRWQGVSLRSLYALRDSLMTLRYLQSTNVNLPMQLNDYLSRWQNDRES